MQYLDEQILYVGRDRLEPEEMLSLLGTRENKIAVQYFLDEQEYLVIELHESFRFDRAKHLVDKTGQVISHQLIGAVKNGGSPNTVSSFGSQFKKKVPPGNPEFFMNSRVDSRIGRLVDGVIRVRLPTVQIASVADLTVDGILHDAMPTAEQIAEVVRDRKG